MKKSIYSSRNIFIALDKEYIYCTRQEIYLLQSSRNMQSTRNTFPALDKEYIYCTRQGIYLLQSARNILIALDKEYIYFVMLKLICCIFAFRLFLYFCQTTNQLSYIYSLKIALVFSKELPWLMRSYFIYIQDIL